jgi:small subunit ribosomal protein S21
MKIMVRDNNVEQALRVMKKKMQREGLFRQLKQIEAFEKPSEKRIREQAEAVRRARKAQRKKLQREGLLPMPKLKPRPPRPGQNREPFNPAGPQASLVQK